LTPLSLRALNRATLARKLLLQRSPISALDAIEHLVGMQAQAPFAPYYGLWSRLDAFNGEELSGLLTSRKAARIVLMRGTIHLVAAKDCHRLRPLVQPALDRMLRTNATHGKPLAAIDVTAVVDAASGFSTPMRSPRVRSAPGWPSNGRTRRRDRSPRPPAACCRWYRFRRGHSGSAADRSG
jgi:hypothetical protein